MSTTRERKSLRFSLHTADGALVTHGALPPQMPFPDVLSLGNKSFTLNTKADDVASYYEASAFEVTGWTAPQHKAMRAR